MIFKGMESIYRADQIDVCNQFNSDCLSKYTWGCCWDVECKHLSWRYVNELLGLTMRSCNWFGELIK